MHQQLKVPDHGTQYEEHLASHHGGILEDGWTVGWTDRWTGPSQAQGIKGFRHTKLSATKNGSPTEGHI